MLEAGKSQPIVLWIICWLFHSRLYADNTDGIDSATFEYFVMETGNMRGIHGDDTFFINLGSTVDLR